MINNIFQSLLVVFLFSTQSWAFPIAPQNPSTMQLPALFTQDYDFEGIVALSNCSGSLVRFETSLDSDKAWILTNGHCYEGGFPNPGKAFYKKSSSRSFTVLDSNAQSLGKVNASELTYATMTGTDIALYRLRESYAEIKNKFNVQALTLDSQSTVLSDHLEIISGYWRRGYTCMIEAVIYQLKEADWLFTNSIRFSRPGCETIGGTSGSPIIRKKTRTVIGINNTGNESGGRCTMNNPCEIDEKGNVDFHRGYSYGQQTSLIYSCLDGNREMDLNRLGCLLQKVN